MGPFVVTLKEARSDLVILSLTVERFEHHRGLSGEVLFAVRGDPSDMAGKFRGGLSNYLANLKRPSVFRRAVVAVKRFIGEG